MDYRGSWWDRIVAAEREILRGLAVVLAVLVLGWLTVKYFTRNSEVKKSISRPTSELLTTAGSRSAAIGEVEAEYLRQANAGGDQTALTHWLDSEIEKTNRRLRSLPDSEITLEQVKLTWLEYKREALHSRASSERSKFLERDAMVSLRSGKMDGVQEALREALRLQRDANRPLTPGVEADLDRESRLANEVARNEIEPIEREIVALLKVADANPAAALTALRSAAERQLSLNDKFAGTAYANMARLMEIETRIATAESAPLVAEMEAAERAAKVASSASQPKLADEAYQKAWQFQRQINEQHPKSQYASAERLAVLERQRQTVLATGMLERVVALDQAAGKLLRAGAVGPALDKIHDASAQLDQVMSEYPLAVGDFGKLRTRLDFLWLLRGRIGRLRTEVIDNLAPLATDRRTDMLHTEIPQSLYAEVMNDNPSASLDNRLPVDSVTCQEAEDFCERLSWVLGRTVRLPTREEFLAVASHAVWSRSRANSDGHSWAVGSMGALGEPFQDLLGNVAEWLQPDSLESAVAHIAGGSYLDSAAQPAAATIIITDKNRRARYVGFRIVLEQ